MKAIQDCYLYGIVDLGYAAPEQLGTITTSMIDGGVDIIQLRAKGHPIEEVIRYATAIQPRTAEASIPLIINDHPSLVCTTHADGVHVGQDDFAVAEAKSLAKTNDILVGKSTHSVAQATAAVAEAPDYIGFGPLFATPTKPDYIPIGLDAIRRVHELVDLPIFCIGGVKLDNMAQILAAGARRVVVVSGILQAADITAYCREVKQLLKG